MAVSEAVRSAGTNRRLPLLQRFSLSLDPIRPMIEK